MCGRAMLASHLGVQCKGGGCDGTHHAVNVWVYVVRRANAARRCRVRLNSKIVEQQRPWACSGYHCCGNAAFPCVCCGHGNRDKLVWIITAAPTRLMANGTETRLVVVST